MRREMTPEDMRAFDTSYKIGLAATVDERGDPHITLLSTLMARNERELMLGRFIVGESKENLEARPKAGFLIMSLQKDFWTGRMSYTSTLSSGEEYERYNSQPLFRYNTYFGVDAVYLLDLVDISEKRALDMPAVVASSIRVMLAKRSFARPEAERLLSPWAEELMGKLDTLAFIAWTDGEGYPNLAPCIQLQAADASTLALTDKPYKELLGRIPAGARVAVFGANLKFESVLMKGRFSGWKVGMASVEIDRVYNSMPPKHGPLKELVPSARK